MSIEGTGMVLTFASGWTSDVIEMQLPMKTRLALDVTKFGDTLHQFIPSKNIEHGTALIRFFHDPSMPMPFTGQPETMKLTYPGGLISVAIVGFVERLGKEEMKIGDLMRTDAVVRVLGYPAMPSLSAGVFPMFTSALVAKQVTDIIETASLRYFIDSSANPANPLIATISPTANFDLVPHLSADLAKDTAVFGHTAFNFYGQRGPYYKNHADIAALFSVSDFTMAWVGQYSPNILSSSANDFYGDTNSTIFTGAMVVGIQIKRNFANPNHRYTANIIRSGSTIATAYIQKPPPVSDTDMLVVVKSESGVVSGYLNNVAFSGSHIPGTVTGQVLMYMGRRANPDASVSGFRDFAFWTSALSSSDFESLNDQLCTEYGIP